MNIPKIKDITKEILERIINELKTPENIEKMHKEVLEPIIGYTFHRLYPYILISSIIFILTFILAVAILLLVIKANLLTSKLN